jgi:hypothetical protein
MLSARCKVCNKELHSTTKVQCCGCSNQMMVVDDKVGAIDLSEVILLNTENNIKKSTILSNADLKYQEERRQRRVRKLYFEER